MLTYFLSIWAIGSAIVWYISVLIINYVKSGVGKDVKLSDYKSRALEYIALFKDEYISKLPPKSAAQLRLAQAMYKISGSSLILCCVVTVIVNNVRR